MRTRDADCCSRPASPGPRRLSYGLKNVAFAPYDDYWREMRKLFVVEMLRAKRVQSIWHARETQVRCAVRCAVSACGVRSNNHAYTALMRLPHKYILV